MIATRRRILAICWIVGACIAWLPGCGRSPIEVEVGVHSIALVPPSGWQHADHGREHLYTRGLAMLSVVDLGAVYLEGFVEEMETAHALGRLAPGAVHVVTALEQLGYNERRDIASILPLEISGRPGIRIDTWDRLSHQYRKRYALLLNGGHLLVVWTRLGSFEECEAAFDGVVASLSFGPPPAY